MKVNKMFKNKFSMKKFKMNIIKINYLLKLWECYLGIPELFIF